MKLKALAIAVLLFASAAAAAQVHVRGHYRKDGTYVQPHIRSAPNSRRSDNYGPSNSAAYGSSYQPVYVSPYARDQDQDGLSNQYDSDDDDDGTLDEYESDPQ